MSHVKTPASRRHSRLSWQCAEQQIFGPLAPRTPFKSPHVAIFGVLFGSHSTKQHPQSKQKQAGHLQRQLAAATSMKTLQGAAEVRNNRQS
jgi:hypothetical protein